MVKLEWVWMVFEGLSVEELDVVKVYLMGVYLLCFDGNVVIVNILVGM